MSDPNNWKEQLYRNSLHFIWDIKQNLFTLLFMKHIQSLKNGERNTGNANRKERLFNKTRNDKNEISISYSGFSETGVSKPPYVHSVFIYSAIFMLLECFWRRCWYYCTLIRQRVLLQNITQHNTNCDKLKQRKDEIMHTPTVKKLPRSLDLAKVLALSWGVSQSDYLTRLCHLTQALKKQRLKLSLPTGATKQWLELGFEVKCWLFWINHI